MSIGQYFKLRYFKIINALLSSIKKDYAITPDKGNEINQMEFFLEFFLNSKGRSAVTKNLK